MPGTADRVVDEQTLGKRRAIMGARGRNGVQLALATDQKRWLSGDMASVEPALGDVRDSDALRKIRSVRLGLRIAHCQDLPQDSRSIG